MKISVLLFLTLFLSPLMRASEDTDSLLLELEQIMGERDQYLKTKEIEIKSLKTLLREAVGKPDQIYYIKNQIIKSYIPYTFDSALTYIDQNLLAARQAKNVKMLNETQLLLSGILTSSGQYKEAMDVLLEINRPTLAKEFIGDYYINFSSVYSELSFYTRAQENREKYKALYRTYCDTLLRILDPQSDAYLSLVEKQLRDSRQLEACMDINTKRLSKVDMGSRTYSTVAFERAINYSMMGNKELYKKFLILSAISDIKASIRDNASLSSLASILYRETDVDRPHKFIQFAFDDAVFFNSRLRFIEISNILPVINQAYQKKTDMQKNKLRASLIVISLLSVIVLLALLLLFRQMKKLSRARKDLQLVNLQLEGLNSSLNESNSKLSNLNIELGESNHVKEQYIGDFIGICSNYIDKLDNYRKVVNKQIASHKVAELYELTKSKSIIEDELKEFYENFDNTFLSIYPNFVDELNALLLEEERIPLKKGELLNTELRIFALIRLGINDSSKIAALLRYSVNTIYNYRVKIKNKAIVPREDFENQVLKIGVFTR